MDSELDMMIYAVAMLALVLAWSSGRIASPLAALAARWVRWAAISVLGAAALQSIQWFQHPFGVLVLVSGLVWFLIESGYSWLAITALSRSDFPLFPRFDENPAGDEWPNQKKCIAMRNWLRQNGYKRSAALIAKVGEQVLVRLSVYTSADGLTRLSVMFFPNARGLYVNCVSFHSLASDGTRLVTDNVFLPFGGFYPENWLVDRRPWTRGLEQLSALHAARIDAYGTSFVPMNDSPLDAINAEQQELESLNRKLGFLSQPDEQESEGRISHAGRYRVWQELWMLNYMGRALRY